MIQPPPPRPARNALLRRLVSRTLACRQGRYRLGDRPLSVLDGKVRHPSGIPERSRFRADLVRAVGRGAGLQGAGKQGHTTPAIVDEPSASEVDADGRDRVLVYLCTAASPSMSAS